MTKKGFILFSIIFASYLLKIIVVALLPQFIDVTNPANYVKGIAPFNLIFGIVTPVIFITQFKNRSIFYSLGIFLIIIKVLMFINAYAYGTGFYLYFGFIVSLANIVGLIIFTTMAFLKEEGKLIASYLILFTIYVVWTSQLVMTLLTYINVSTAFLALVSGTIPLFLQYASLSLLLYVVLVECQKTPLESTKEL